MIPNLSLNTPPVVRPLNQPTEPEGAANAGQASNLYRPSLGWLGLGRPSVSNQAGAVDVEQPATQPLARRSFFGSFSRGASDAPHAPVIMKMPSQRETPNDSGSSAALSVIAEERPPVQNNLRAVLREPRVKRSTLNYCVFSITSILAGLALLGGAAFYLRKSFVLQQKFDVDYTRDSFPTEYSQALKAYDILFDHISAGSGAWLNLTDNMAVACLDNREPMLHGDRLICPASVFSKTFSDYQLTVDQLKERVTALYNLLDPGKENVVILDPDNISNGVYDLIGLLGRIRQIEAVKAVFRDRVIGITMLATSTAILTVMSCFLCILWRMINSEEWAPASTVREASTS